MKRVFFGYGESPEAEGGFKQKNCGCYHTAQSFLFMVTRERERKKGMRYGK